MFCSYSACKDQTREPDEQRTKCVCPAGTYNRAWGFIFCFNADAHENPLAAKEYEPARAALLHGGMCIPCPKKCVACSRRGEVLIKPGFGMSRAMTNKYVGLQAGVKLTNKSLFSCDQNKGACAGETAGGEQRRWLRLSFEGDMSSLGAPAKKELQARPELLLGSWDMCQGPS